MDPVRIAAWLRTNDLIIMCDRTNWIIQADRAMKADARGPPRSWGNDVSERDAH